VGLYLVQHGKCLPKDVDPEQGLSEEGRREVARVAAVAANYAIRVATIAHSGKKRALQTAEIIATALNLQDKVAARSGMEPLDEVGRHTADLRSRDDTMLVGHLPFMERLAAALVTGTAEKTVIKFQNGGIVCLEQDPESGFWFIKWTLMPRID
jgi:phosphohistidine phosphatase